MFSENALSVLGKRYLKDGETPEALFKRVADNIASAELLYDKKADVKSLSTMFYNEMYNLRFLPNSPTLMNAGKELQQLSACFVLPVEDSLEGIFEAVKNTAMIHKSGGGTGFSFSRLRPKNSTVKTTKGVSSGPVSFMSVFNAATETIKQGGMRRGANMGILRVDHPDIMEFIHAKKDKTQLTNFNLSVGVTDKFMEAVKENKDYDLIDPKTKEAVGKLSARKVFDDMVKLAWEGGDPGVIFLDRINQYNPTPKQGEIEATNPCWSGDTLVATYTNGVKTFRELAETGDDVLVYALDTKKKQVVSRWMRKPHKTGTINVVKLTVKVPEKEKTYDFRLTPSHLLYIYQYDGDFRDIVRMEAQDLRPGMQLVSYDLEDDQGYYGGGETDSVWEVVNVTPEKEKIDVYNGNVDDKHNYFIVPERNVKPGGISGFLSKNCGEQPLLPYESCNLGSINLAKFVKDGKIDWDELKDTVHAAVWFLDNVIDMNRYPLKQIEETTRGNRKIGLGIMGWADTLVQMGIAYNSPEACELAEEIMCFIRTEGKCASEELAKRKGAYPNCDRDIPVRNATITTIAPTGTISIIADASSGIEPYFALAYYRNIMDNDKLPEVNRYFVEIAKREGFHSDELMKKLAEKGSCQGLPEVPEKWQKVFVTAHDISPKWHLNMQLAFQKHTDNAVSKTINFCNSTTVKDIEESYLTAYNIGLKGTTVYRDGCRDGQTLNIGKTEKPADNKRPAELYGRTVKLTTGCGKMYITINRNSNGNLREVFTSIGKAGGCAQSQSEAIGRLISAALRAGVKPELIIKQLKGISCHMKAGFGANAVLSCADAVGKALEQELGLKAEKHKSTGGACPECGAVMEHTEGCGKCTACGYSHCG